MADKSIDVPVVREVHLRRRYSDEKCCLCGENPPQGKISEMTISHLPILSVDRYICHFCVETLSLAWVKAKKDPDSITQFEEHLLSSRKVYTVTCLYSAEELSDG